MTETSQPQPYAHRPGPRSRPRPGADPARQALGKSARRRGSENEKRTLRHLIGPIFPDARRTRVGESGSDIYSEGVGRRILELTVARWNDIGGKLDQAAADATAAGVAEYAVIKPRQVLPGRRRQWFAILDAETYLRQARELDILRAFHAAVGHDSTREHVIHCRRLARLALDQLEGVDLDAID